MHGADTKKLTDCSVIFRIFVERDRAHAQRLKGIGFVDKSDQFLEFLTTHHDYASLRSANIHGANKKNLRAAPSMRIV